MSQDPIIVTDGSGAAVLTNSNSQLNLALKTIATDFAGPTPPSSPLQYQTWWDTTANIVKKYDGTNWIPMALGPVIIKTGNYNFTVGDVNGIYQANSGSAIAFTLLAANGVRNGAWLHIKNIAAGVLTINGTINGAANPTLAQNGEAFIWSDGSAWRGLLFTSANVASSAVMRDASGNFAAGMITANLTGAVTGNAATASSAAKVADSVILTGDTSASSNGGTTSLNLGTVTAGDVILVASQMQLTSGILAGMFTSVIAKGAGTALVNFMGLSSLAQYFYLPANTLAIVPNCGYVVVSGTGTLTLDSTLGFVGNPASVTNQIAAIFLRKR